MRLLTRLALTITSVVFLAILAYLALPLLLSGIIRHELNQQGFTGIDVEFGEIGWRASNIKNISLSSRSARINIQNTKLDYQPAKLASTGFDGIKIENISVKQLTEQPGQSKDSLSGIDFLSGLLSIAWHESLPANEVHVQTLALYAPDGLLTLEAAIGLIRQGQEISGAVDLTGKRQPPQHLDLTFSPQSGIHIVYRSGNEVPLTVNLRNMADLGGLSGNIELNFAQLPELLGLPAGLSGDLQADIDFSPVPGSSEKIFSIDGTVGKLEGKDWSVKTAAIRLSGQIEQQDGVYQLHFQDTSQLTLENAAIAQITLQKTVIEPPESMRIGNGQIRISDEQNASITMHSVSADDFNFEYARLAKLSFANSRGDNGQANCKYGGQFESTLIVVTGTNVHPDSIEFRGSCPERQKGKWSMSATTETLSVENEIFTVSANGCSVTLGNVENGRLIDQDPNELGGKFSCDAGALSNDISFRFRFNPATEIGRVEYSLANIQPDSETPLLGNVLKDWDTPYDLVSGTLDIGGDYRWWINSTGLPREALSMNLDINAAGGHYQGILFSDLEYHGSLDLLPEIRASEFSKLHIGSIDIAIPIHNAVAEFRLGASDTGPLPSLDIRTLNLPLLDGNVYADDLRVDLNAQTQKLLFQLKALNLAEIIDLQQVDGLSATGALDGHIPVNFTATGVNITAGRITAQDPGGHIRYVVSEERSEAAKAVGGSGLVLKVLENLDYHSMVADVEYDEDGELRLLLALKGTSPQVDANRPIHFNLNLEQNLLTLLKGLRYAQGISDDIDNNVQKYFSEQKNPLN